VQILRDRFETPPFVLGGLVLYTVATTIIPSVFLRAPVPDFDTPELPALDTEVSRQA